MSQNALNELTNGSWWIESGGWKNVRKRQQWETLLIIVQQPEEL